MRRFPVVLYSLVLAAALMSAPPAGAVTSTTSGVVAVVGDQGINVLHEQFRLVPGQTAAVPAEAGAVSWIDLPSSGSFEQRLTQLGNGPLGAMDADTLYGVRGTRLLLKSPRDGYNLLADMSHGTQTAAAVTGATTGSNPDALVVFAAENSAETWGWLSSQPWIDVATDSVASVASDCQEMERQINNVIDGGRVVFASGGNGGHHGYNRAALPMSLPRVYRVGAAEYQPHNPNSVDTRDTLFHQLPVDNAETGLVPTSGTSFAAPFTAGRAALLITHARKTLGSTQAGVADGNYAVGHGPAGGPLADGDFTADELTLLMHAVAVPQFTEAAAHYWVEGFGVLNDAAVARAMRILDGAESLQQRAEEAEHRRDEELRAETPRCPLPAAHGDDAQVGALS